MSTCCKAIIFDLDGTLLNTVGDLTASMNYALSVCGYSEREPAHHAWAIGNGLRKYAERCLPENAVSDEVLDNVCAAFSEHYSKNSAVFTVPYDGILSLLDFCQDKNICINVLSNKMDGFVNELTSHYFGKYSFGCVNGEIKGVARKPHPEAALKIAQKCNIAPDEILFVGDSIYDIQTGRNAGMKTLAVTWGYQPKEMLAAENPDFIADTPQDIIEYIKQQLGE